MHTLVQSCLYYCSFRAVGAEPEDWETECSGQSVYHELSLDPGLIDWVDTDQAFHQCLAHISQVYMCVCVRVCVCVRACVRLCACVRVCVWVHVKRVLASLFCKLYQIQN